MPYSLNGRKQSVREDPLIVALDLSSAREAEKLIQQLGASVLFYKVGLRLFTQEGPDFIRYLKSKKKKVFLDLKFHDIPNTVAGAVESATGLGVDLLTVHALGGLEMMQAAVKSARETAKRLKKSIPEIFAVTILTSHSEISELGIKGSISKEVLRLAELAEKAKVSGLVCSPEEVKFLRKNGLNTLKILTPGIRLPEDKAGDQKRIATPAAALKAGANYLVVGRPVYEHSRPAEAVQKIRESYLVNGQRVLPIAKKLAVRNKDQ